MLINMCFVFVAVYEYLDVKQKFIVADHTQNRYPYMMDHEKDVDREDKLQVDLFFGWSRLSWDCVQMSLGLQHEQELNKDLMILKFEKLILE
jgi:hypothetical protein